MHLQSAEELERLKAEEDSSSGSSASLDSGIESLGVCILEEPLAVPGRAVPGASLPPFSSRLSCPRLLRAVFCRELRTTRPPAEQPHPI